MSIEQTVEEAQLLGNYPLRVQFPKLAGRYMMLNWWTHNEQNHLTLGKTEEQVAAIYKKLLTDPNSEFKQAEPVAFFQIDIVSPPWDLRVRSARKLREEELRSFSSWVSGAARELIEAGDPLPEGFSKCSNWASRWDDADPPDEFEQERHMACKNCNDGLVFDAEKLFAEKRRLYLNAPSLVLVVPRLGRGGPSEAPVADPERNLFIATDRHGHHSDGSILEQVMPDEVIGGYGTPIKFFCHATKLDVPKVFTDLRVDMDEQWAKSQEQFRAAYRAKNDADAKRLLDYYRSFFRSEVK